MDKELGITYSDLLTKDLVVIVISAGATNTSLLAVKGLMQMRAYKELSTIIFTNYWGIVMQSFCDDIPTYSLAKLCSIEYVKKESEEQVEQPKNKPIINNTSSMTAEQFKNLFKSS
jgi:hypothetical protein